MKKIIFMCLGVVIISLVAYLNISSASVKSDEDHLSDIVDLTWEKYDVLASSILIDDSVLFIEVSDTESKKEVGEFVKNKLVERDVKTYSTEIVLGNVEEKEELIKSSK